MKEASMMLPLHASAAYVRSRAGLLFVLVMFGSFSCAFSQWQANVLTYHYDNTRAGQNTNETILTLANVNPASFKKLFSYVVDGYVYAEPLYVSRMLIPGQGMHNVVFVATEHNSVYAFDADSNTGPAGGLLWHTNLGPSAATPNNDFGNRYGPYHDINPEVGITGTPVIDLPSGTLYLDAFTHEGSSYFHRIHALNITNGTEQPFSPVVVGASIPGNGVGSANGVLVFSAKQHLQRPALTRAGGILYVCYSGYADTDPYHGWVLGFNATNLLQLTNCIFNTTPNSTTAAYGANAGEGGIWMTGNGLAVDSSTNVYLEVGNGIFNANHPGGTEYGDSFLKLSFSNQLAVVDYFTPYNQATLAANDTDLGSGGTLLLPDSDGSATHPHLLVGCGKQGKIYLLDRDSLGHFNAANDNQIVQSLPGAVGGTWSSPAYFNHLVYYQGKGDVLKAFRISNGLLVTNPVSASTTSFGYPGATPVISANGTSDAIAWVLQTDGYGSGSPAVLHAYNATNLNQELYSSSAGNAAGGAVKFTVPTVVNGKVYVGGQRALAVFGLSADSPPTVTLTSPADTAVFVADSATIPISADANDSDGFVRKVDFYSGSSLIASLTSSPYNFNWVGVPPGSYALTAQATDNGWQTSTSAPVMITVKAARGAPYGLTNRAGVGPYLNMPDTINGPLPLLLSGTGAFQDTPALGHAAGLIPYDVNVPLWSDGAAKTRWLAVPNSGGALTPDEQIGFATNGEWTFPNGTVFVKHFELVTDETQPNVRRRLETRLLVRDAGGAVYGVTYKWRADNSEADLLLNSLREDITITNSSGVRTQTWYYPSPADCLTCHTPVSGYVLGVKTRQLNRQFLYQDSGVSDNQLRTLNRLGLFNPPITDESQIPSFDALSALTNTAAALEDRFRSYIDANCAQCHRPGGVSYAGFDARYDTPLTNQSIVNGPVGSNLGYDRAAVVVPNDIWRSILFRRMNTTDPMIRMPLLARSLIDSNAVTVVIDWINSLGGTPALAPPTITPGAGAAYGSITVSLQDTNQGVELRYTMDGSLPTSTSLLYSGPLAVTNTTTLTAKAFEAGFIDSVATTAIFDIQPALALAPAGVTTNSEFQLRVNGFAGRTYVLQSSTNLDSWVAVSTNTAPSDQFLLVSPPVPQSKYQFYRVFEMP